MSGSIVTSQNIFRTISGRCRGHVQLPNHTWTFFSLRRSNPTWSLFESTTSRTWYFIIPLNIEAIVMMTSRSITWLVFRKRSRRTKTRELLLNISTILSIFPLTNTIIFSTFIKIFFFTLFHFYVVLKYLFDLNLGSLTCLTPPNSVCMFLS